ncbi:hypothetical protein BDY19DRAFT_165169 [Irpex rosettiformis]|uniref:Uncharacterized protein n=1 Tax=Irpex rosettiformis TaxID=378272 RepID=A0ACB8U2K7_9APHY|nr:hypothetical protein BDY19DRAFT_165169 [Irpex rosettiformis]
MPVSSRYILALSGAIIAATAYFLVFGSSNGVLVLNGEHEDGLAEKVIRTQKIEYRVSYFTWKSNSGWSLYSPSLTALALLSLIVTWKPTTSTLKKTITTLVVLAFSLWADISYTLYLADHLSTSTSPLCTSLPFLSFFLHNKHPHRNMATPTQSRKQHQSRLY